MNPRQRRLHSDFKKVKKLIAVSGGSLKLIRSIPLPPTNYIIEYHCPSLVKNNHGRITKKYHHKAEIILGINYPLEMPQAKMLTPVFNPHIYEPSNRICLGLVWSAAETLDLLILKIGALLQLDPIVLDHNSPANLEANQWVKQNRDRIPLGKISFRAAEIPKNRIEWS